MTLALADLTIGTLAGDILIQNANERFDCGLTAITGQNGAGKSTLLRSIFGLHPLTSGTITLSGLDSRRDRTKFLRKAIFQPQNFSAYHELTGPEFLLYFARLRGASRSSGRADADRWIERVGLGDASRKTAGSYSQGMLQRLGLAYALQTATELCVLDEPFAGIDPSARNDLTDLVAEASENRIIIVCTHHVEEVVARGARIVEVRDARLQS